MFATGKQCFIKYYDAHFNAYEVTVTDAIHTFFPQKAPIPWPVFAFSGDKRSIFYRLFQMYLPDVEFIA